MITARIEFVGQTKVYDFDDLNELNDSLNAWTSMNILESAEIISWDNLKGNPKPNQVWSITKRDWVSKT